MFWFGGLNSRIYRPKYRTFIFVLSSSSSIKAYLQLLKLIYEVKGNHLFGFSGCAYHIYFSWKRSMFQYWKDQYLLMSSIILAHQEKNILDSQQWNNLISLTRVINKRVQIYQNSLSHYLQRNIMTHPHSMFLILTFCMGITESPISHVAQTDCSFWWTVYLNHKLMRCNYFSKINIDNVTKSRSDWQ